MKNPFAGIRGILLDLNGVFYVDNHIFPGALETIEFIRSRNIPCLFTTNTTTRTRDSLCAELQKMGLPIEKSEIISPPQAAVVHLRSLGQPRCHLLIREELKKEFAEFPTSHTNPDVIVIGDIGDRWNYRILNQAFQMMMYGAELVALHRGRFWQVGNELHLDIGAIVAGLEYAGGKRATIIGKPSPAFFRLSLQELGLPANEVAMIGDDIDMDVGGAIQAGLKGILVKTGKYRPALAAASSIKPDGTLDGIADLQKFF